MRPYQREAAMAALRRFDIHLIWEDYTGTILGILIGLSPWLTGGQVKLLATGNAVAVGVMVLAFAAFELVDLNRSEEVGEIVLGLWLIASPFVLNYADSQLAIWHFALGAVVVLLATLELWQDWSLTERELMRHGRK
jgi:O-antigen/teichoic acid export membrane protein